MEHGGEAARLTATAAGSIGLGTAPAAGAFLGTEAANVGSGALDGPLGAAPGSFFTDFDLSGAHHNSTGFVRHVRGEAPVAAGFHLRRQPAPGVAVLVGPQLPGGAVPVHGNYGYYPALLRRPGVVLDAAAVYNGNDALQPRPGAVRGEVPVDLLGHGAVHGGAFVGQLPGGGGAAYGDYAYYALQPSPGAGHGEDLLRNGAGYGEAFVGQLQGGGVAAYHDHHRYYARQPRPGAGHGQVLVDLLRDGAGHGEVFVGLLPGGGGALHDGNYGQQPRPGAGRGEVLVELLRHDAGDGEAFVGQLPGGGGVATHGDYAYYVLQPRPGAGQHGEVLVDLLREGVGHGEVFAGLLPGGGGAVHGDYGHNPWQPRPGAALSEVLSGGVGVVFDGDGNFARQTLAAPGTGGPDGIAGAGYGPYNLGEGYDNRGVVGEHLRPLLPFVGIGASSVAINGLAAGPGSPAVAFQLFVLLLGGLLLVILHVLRV